MLSKTISFFKETLAELRRVNWPSRSETIRLTTIVIIVSVFVAIILGVFDLAFIEGVKALIKIY